MRSLLLLAVALAFGACSSSGGNADDMPEPPPGTGQITIDMDSWWVIDSIQRLDSSAPVPGADPMASPFLSIQVGQLISIEQGQAYDLATSEPLYGGWSPAVPNRRYLNLADGRFWLFDFLHVYDADCFMHVAIQAAFGSVDESTMDGIVEVLYLSSCPAPAVLRPNPNGTYAVRMVKVVPSQLAPETGK